MANLPETSQWPAGIYQIETQDPVLGGPPDLAQGQGIANVAAKQLADRTLFLKTSIGGLGGVAPTAPGTNLNTVNKTSTLMIAPGDTGSPATAYYGTLTHTEGTGGRAWQMAIMSDGRSYTRHRTNSAPTWASWERAWGNADAQTLFAANGYRIAPDGLIMQWGTGSITGGGPQSGNWPIAFPNAFFSGVGTDPGAGVHAVALDGSLTQWTARSRNPDGTVSSATAFRFLAIGW